MAVVNRNNSQPVYLTPPSELLVNQNTVPANGVSFNPAPNPTALQQTDNVNLNVNIVPSNYPQVTNNIPANIFPQANTTPNPTTQTTGTVPTTGGTAPTTGTNTALKPITMTEAQWAVKFEEKVKGGYKPPQQEMAKYQDIVARYKANPKVDSSILEILAAQSSSLGAQVASMRYGGQITEAIRGMKPGATPLPSVGDDLATASTEKVTAGGLKGIGGTLLKGSGLSAIVAGGFSLVTNGIQVLQGKKQWNEIAGTVGADTMNGAVSGITGTLGAGLAGLVVGGTGLIPTLVIGLGAMGGAWAGDKLFRGTGLYDKIKNGIDGLFNGSASLQNNQQQYNATSTQYQGAQTYVPK